MVVFELLVYGQTVMSVIITDTVYTQLAYLLVVCILIVHFLPVCP